MKKLFYIILLFPFLSKAQHLEVGALLGVSNYFGDLAPQIVPKETHPAFGAYARLNLSSSFAFTGSITSATISGNDKNFAYNNLRNLNFSTSLTELAAIVEFNFFKYGVDVLDKKFTPYVFLGIALTAFEPSARYQGTTVKLRNLQTENQQYGNFATCIPMGMGVKWQFHRHFAFEANVGFRRSYSDYLDDVSTVYPDPAATAQGKGVFVATVTDPSALLSGGAGPVFPPGYRRGNADYTDWYIISSASISYRFYKRSKCRRFY